TIGWILGEIEKEEEREQEAEELVRKVEKAEKEGKERVNEEEVLEAWTGEVKEQNQKVSNEPTQLQGSVDETSTPSAYLLESKSKKLMEPG
ncbi:MAG: hypothetical protein Q9214_005362, partial [Letrouitia sp. 1 TL-2023]